MGNNQSEGHDFKICAAQCQRPLKFNYMFDNGGHISPNQLIFRKFDQGKAAAVGDRPLMTNEILCVKIIIFHKGNLKFGVTTINPENLTFGEFEGMILNNPNALILKLLSKKSIQKDNILFFQYTTDGEIVFGWSKKGKIREKLTLITGLQRDTPLWAVFDVFGKNIVFRLENELIPLLASVPSEMMKVQSLDLTHQSLESIPAGVMRTGKENKDATIRLRKAMSCNKLDQPESSDVSLENKVPFSYISEETTLPRSPQSPQLKAITDFSKFFKLPISALEDLPSPHQSFPGGSSSRRTPKLELKFPMTFHPTTGKHVSLFSDETSARRTTDSCNAYVFSGRPISPDETISISLNIVDASIKKGLGFGMTVCDPGTISEFPDDGDDLLDRSEYWVYVKDVVRNASEGDEVSFCLSRRGRVGMTRNGAEEKTLVHVDTSLPLWMFFDVTGCVQHISCLGVSKRQSSRKDSNFRTDRNFHKNNDRIIIPERSNFSTHPQISASVDIADPILPNNNETSRRNSTNNINPNFPPKIQPKGPKPLPKSPTQNPPNNLFTADLPHSLVAPLIPLPSKSPTPSNNNPASPSTSHSINPSTSQTKNPSTSRLISPSNTQPTNPSTSRLISPSNTQTTNPPTSRSTNRPTNLSIINTIHSQLTDEGIIEETPKIDNTIDISELKNKISSLKNHDKLAVTVSGMSLNPQDINELLQKIESLKGPTNHDESNQAECSICLDLPPDCVLYTCGHMCMCHACAKDVLNSPTPYCPICRKEIKDIVKIYRS